MSYASSSSDPIAGYQKAIVLTGASTSPYVLNPTEAGKMLLNNATPGTLFPVTLPEITSDMIGINFTFRSTIVSGFTISSSAGAVFRRNGNVMRSNIDTLTPDDATSFELKGGTIMLVAVDTTGWELVPIDAPSLNSNMGATGYGAFERWAYLEQKESDLYPTAIPMIWQGGFNSNFELPTNKAYAGSVVILAIHAGTTASPAKLGMKWWVGEIAFYRSAILSSTLTLKDSSGANAAEIGTVAMGQSGSSSELTRFNVTPGDGTPIDCRWYARISGVEGIGNLLT